MIYFKDAIVSMMMKVIELSEKNEVNTNYFKQFDMKALTAMYETYVDYLPVIKKEFFKRLDANAKDRE